MSDLLQKFPSTPHLTWLGMSGLRDEKLLTLVEANRFLSGPVTVEEKVDGANLGISFGVEGRLRFQNRGNWLNGRLTGQWGRLRMWAADHEAALREVLPKNHILFGEWCYATHSIHYDHLPDWFLAFDVYDLETHKFWSVNRRNTLASAARLATVPVIARGVFTPAEIVAMLDGPSACATDHLEGLYLRREVGAWLGSRAKVVSAEFTQSILEHWSGKPVRQNHVNNAVESSK